MGQYSVRSVGSVKGGFPIYDGLITMGMKGKGGTGTGRSQKNSLFVHDP